MVEYCVIHEKELTNSYCPECMEPILKALKFVKHIEDHLEKMDIKGIPMCKICGKDIDEINAGDKIP